MKIPPYHGPERSGGKAEKFDGLRTGNSADRVSGSSVRGAGIDSVTITGKGKVQESVVYRMSDLKGKADRALAAQKALQERRADKPEPLADSRIGATRQELMDLARLRINAGFYNRADVTEAIAKRIMDSF